MKNFCHFGYVLAFVAAFPGAKSVAAEITCLHTVGTGVTYADPVRIAEIAKIYRRAACQILIRVANSIERHNLTGGRRKVC